MTDKLYSIVEIAELGGIAYETAKQWKITFSQLAEVREYGEQNFNLTTNL